VLGFDLRNTTRLAEEWPILSNKAAMEVSQSWESGRADPSGSLLKSWQDATKTSVVVGCGPGCPCQDKNPKCKSWAKEGQCTANPGYMRAMCAAACPRSLNASGWVLDGTSVHAPDGQCLDAAGQLTPAPGSGLNWLRTVKCDASSRTQQFVMENDTLKSVVSGQCLGVESHWLWVSSGHPSLFPRSRARGYRLPPASLCIVSVHEADPASGTTDGVVGWMWRSQDDAHARQQ
jgi:hypothetical protein